MSKSKLKEILKVQTVVASLAVDITGLLDFGSLTNSNSPQTLCLEIVSSSVYVWREERDKFGDVL
jgi:hypothetical protein